LSGSANLSLFDAEIRFEIINRAINEGDRGILDSISREQQLIDSVLNHYPEAERHEYRSHLQEINWQEMENARQLNRAALFLACYSTFEFFVLKFTLSYLEASSLKLRLKDIGGSGYEKFVVVADRIAMKRRRRAEIWQDVSGIRDVRNFFAHNGGLAFEEEQKAKVRKALEVIGHIDLLSEDGSGALTVNLDARFMTLVHAKLNCLVQSAYWTLFEEETVC
jgi:hypothetical protein